MRGLPVLLTFITTGIVIFHRIFSKNNINFSTESESILKPLPLFNKTLISNKFSCTESCRKNNGKKTPRFIDRKSLKADWQPDYKLLDKWSAGGKARLNFFTDNLTAQNENDLLTSAKTYVDDYWFGKRDVELEIVTVFNQQASDVLIQNFRVRENEIPEVYHYTWFNCREFTFIHMASILSVLRFMEPSAMILFHTDCTPNGVLWQNVVSLSQKRLKIVKIRPMKTVWDRRIKEIVHVSDIYRILVLYKFGGIYLDDDMVLLKSHSNWLINQHVPVLAEESQASVANGFMIAPAQSTIMLRWLVEYKSYSSRNTIIGLNSVLKMWCLWQRYPKEINVVKGLMVRPNWKEKGMLFYGHFDWSKSYNVHLNQRFVKPMLDSFEVSLSFDGIDCLDTSFGEILRFIFYERFEVCA